MAGETAQPLPGSLELPSIALATSRSSWLKSARAFCELDRLGLLRVGLGGRGQLELVEHEVAVGRPAGALVGQAAVGQDLEPQAGDPGQLGLGRRS